MDNDNLEIKKESCEAGETCETCETCEICETCETCESCETCEACETCESCETCEPCEACETCESENEEEDKPQKKHLIKNKIVREIVSWVGTILLAIVIAIIINTYFFRISRVSGGSMKQTYQPNDVVYLTRLPYIFGDIEKNEIVIFDSSFQERSFFTDVKEALMYNAISYKLFGTEQPTRYYIKRVIAVAGDTIQIKEDGVYVNGKLLEEPYVNNEEQPYYARVSEKLKNGFTVPDDYIFVMGDNRNHSSDSREIGCVPENSVIGKVIGS